MDNNESFFKSFRTEDNIPTGKSIWSKMVK